MRIAKYKGGWDIDLKLARLDNFSYKTQFSELTGGNLMVQAINSGAIDLALASEIPLKNYCCAQCDRSSSKKVA
ncbi:hypothetical protein BV372_16385 [Nostoc sp. T09]|uniref:hypothetical protein n=1 Tax=Nostoc sp. T09 TaxID=1932621 RepID=UPI000B70EF2C|nr:hypothetical protein [Nostoc sp. T09]OUL33429.1 hypothetical protein BV372_16385 [Nostoc sp. T09]